ncbi:MAG: ATP-binding cassette domain-containing protein, partial [Planctomycetota bacterium]
MSAPQFELCLRLPLAHFTLELELASSARTLGVFGPSGAGKTSLLEAVAGWRALERRGAGYVPQDALLFPHWNVARNVRAGVPADAAREHEELVSELLSMLEITHLVARPVTSLSGGERQRVALARALAARPR